MARRILIYTNHFYPENFKVNDVAGFLNEEGYDVSVITGIPNYPEGKIKEGYGYFKRRKESWNGIKVNRLWLIPRGSGSSIRMVLNYISYFISCLFYTFYITIFKKKYDVILVHHTSPIFIAIPPIFYRWIHKPKMILWDLDMWPDTLVAMNILKSKNVIVFIEKIVTWIYKKYDAILIGSRSFADIAKNRVEESKIEYFPNWAEDVFIQNKIVPPVNEPTFPKGFNLMYAGNIGEAQDFKSVFEAIKLLRGQGINWLIVGDGRWLHKFKTLIKKDKLSNEVYFYGNNPLESMPYFYSKADVMFISLQDRDIFSKTVPAKLQSYMAAGKPILGMMSGEGNKIIKEANCGISVDSGDFEGMAKSVIKLKENSQILLLYERNSKDFYGCNFSMKDRKKQLIRLILK